MSLYNEWGTGMMLPLPSADESLRREIYQYFHYKYGEQESLTFEQAAESMLFLDHHLTARLLMYEKAERDRAMYSLPAPYIVDKSCLPSKKD
jgi:hypothetical protein